MRCISLNLADFNFFFSLVVFRNYDPNFMAASLDEAYLDITDVCRARGMVGAQVSFHVNFNCHEI